MLTTVPLSDTTTVASLVASPQSSAEDADMVLRLGSPHPFWKSAKVNYNVV
jgi:hypothetical protein